nr:hypothetical protein [Actinomycetota bacterium]
DLTSLAAELQRTAGVLAAHDLGGNTVKTESGAGGNGSFGANPGSKTLGQGLRVMAQDEGSGTQSVYADSEGTGLVLVTPEAFKETALDPVVHLRLVTGWPVLGIITYKQERFLRNKDKGFGSRDRGTGIKL